jgi:hypothetical protein
VHTYAALRCYRWGLCPIAIGKFTRQSQARALFLAHSRFPGHPPLAGARAGSRRKMWPTARNTTFNHCPRILLFLLALFAPTVRTGQATIDDQRANYTGAWFDQNDPSDYVPAQFPVDLSEVFDRTWHASETSGSTVSITFTGELPLRPEFRAALTHEQATPCPCFSLCLITG